MDHQELLEELVTTLDNLPSEIRHLFNELRTRSEDYYEIRAHIAVKDIELKKMIKSGPLESPLPDTMAQQPSAVSAVAPSSSSTSTNPVNLANSHHPVAAMKLEDTAASTTQTPTHTQTAPLQPSTAQQQSSSNAVINTTTTASTTQNSTSNVSSSSLDASVAAGANNRTSTMPPAASTSTTGLEWKTGAEAVEGFPDQKEAFWKIVAMFGDCGRIADEKINIVERSKNVLDRHIKRIAAQLEAHGILPAGHTGSTASTGSGGTPGPAAGLLPPAQHVRSISQPNLFATPSAAGVGAGVSAISGVGTPAAAVGLGGGGGAPSSKFLSQRSVSSGTDILHKATELAAAVVADAKALDAAAAVAAAAAAAAGVGGSAGAGVGGVAGPAGLVNRVRGSTPDRVMPKRPMGTTFGAGPSLHGGVTGPFGVHGHQAFSAQHALVSGLAAGVGGVAGTPGFTPNKTRIKKRKFDEGSGSNLKQHPHSASGSGGGGGGSGGGNEEAEEDVYCICQRVSFGEMIGCDSNSCEKEWFHLECVGLKAPPEGVWLCPECVKKAVTGPSVVPSGGGSLDDDDDLDADESVVKKSVFATTMAAASQQKKKRVR